LLFYAVISSKTILVVEKFDLQLELALDCGIMLPGMEKTVKVLRDAGVSAKIMIDGALITQGYADKIGADGYAPVAASAVDVAKSLVA